MADVLDVVNTMVSQVAGYVYPNGTGEQSVTGGAINIFPGWPLPDQIDNDMPQGIVDVSVFPVPGMERNTTRYRPAQKVMSVAEPTLTLKAAANVVTVGGAMPSPFTPHNLAVLVGGHLFGAIDGHADIDRNRTGRADRSRLSRHDIVGRGDHTAQRLGARRRARRYDWRRHDRMGTPAGTVQGDRMGA
jgi:hypothetical protein